MDFFLPSTKTESFFLREVLLPFCLLLAILAGDHVLFTGVTVAPLLNLLAMGFLAMYLRPAAMVFWAFCYVSSTVVMLRHPEFSLHGSANIVLTTHVRILSAVVGGLVAILLCASRAKAAKNHQQLFTLLKRMPMPFVISDRNGTLLFVSEDASRLMNISKEEATGQSYFALLMNVSDQGLGVQRYVTLLDAQADQESRIEVRLPGRSDEIYDGILMPVDVGSGRCLITVIKHHETSLRKTAPVEKMQADFSD